MRGRNLSIQHKNKKNKLQTAYLKSFVPPPHHPQGHLTHRDRCKNNILHFRKELLYITPPKKSNNVTRLTRPCNTPKQATPPRLINPQPWVLTHPLPLFHGTQPPPPPPPPLSRYLHPFGDVQDPGKSDTCPFRERGTRFGDPGPREERPRWLEGVTLLWRCDAPVPV